MFKNKIKCQKHIYTKNPSSDIYANRKRLSLINEIASSIMTNKCHCICIFSTKLSFSLVILHMYMPVGTFGKSI